MMLNCKNDRLPGLTRTLGGWSLGLALIFAVLPARADIDIDGVRDGQTVQGSVQIRAQHDTRGSTSVELDLRGPNGFRIRQDSQRSVIRLVTETDGEKTVDWDTSRAPEGDYVLIVSGASVSRSGRRVETQVVRFRVEHEAEVASVAPSIQGVQQITSLPMVNFVDADDTTLTIGQASDMAFEIDGGLPVGADMLVLAWSPDREELVPNFAHVVAAPPYQIAASQLNLLPIGKVELQLRLRVDGQIVGKVAKNVLVRNRASASIRGGSNETVTETPAAAALQTTGDQPTTSPTPPTTVKPSTARPKLPTVSIRVPDPQGELQPKPTLTTVKPTPADANSADEFDVQFSDSTPTQYALGSNQDLALEVVGDLPDGADILVLMWHNDEREMVSGFAHAITQAPFEIRGDKLDAVPAGRVELQTLLRVPGEPMRVEKRQIELVAATATSTTPDVAADYRGLTLTEDGFTQFTKSADTQVIYVAQNGSDDNDGLSPSTPLKTPSTGYAKLRSGYPDWLLFKAGDTFEGGVGLLHKSGRSAAERLLIGVYGEGPRPVFNVTGTNWGGKLFTTRSDNIAIVGLHLTAPQRDTRRGNFRESDLEDHWKQGGIGFLGGVENVLIEDLVVEYFNVGFVFQSNSDHGYMTGLEIRRSAIVNSYGHWDSSIGGHAQGIYAQYVNGMVIDECVWDHNGWNPDVEGAVRTKFNHNLYIQNDCLNVTVKRSIISRGSAHGLQLRPGGVIEDNLFVGNALAFFTGQHPSVVRRNVILQSDDMGSAPGDERGMGMEILPCEHVVIENNIVSQKVGSAEFGAAIHINWNHYYIEWLEGKPYNVVLKDNKIHNWPRYQGRETALLIDSAANLLENERNVSDLASGGGEDPPWIDPDRDVESYMESLGRTPSFNDFMHAAAHRPRGQWVSEFSAEAVNHYIRRGFDVRPFD